MLEDRFEPWLCNARQMKKRPGRKTDLSGAERLADVTQIDARVAEIQRMEKVLQDAGIKLTSVASQVLTQSGRAMT